MKRLALLSRIDMSDTELVALQGEMESILGYVDKVGELVTEEKVADVGIHRNIMREDEQPHESGAYTEALLDAAPAREGDFMKVKKIL